MTQGVDRAAVLNYLTDSMRVLHAEDQRLRLVLEGVKSRRVVGPADFEALVDAQQTALRIPANMLLMLAALIEDGGLDSTREGARPSPRPVATRKRFKLALLALAGAFDDHQ